MQAKKRQWRIEEEVLPELLKYRDKTAKRIAQEMKFAGLAKGGVEQFRKIHLERLKAAVRCSNPHPCGLGSGLMSHFC